MSQSLNLRLSGAEPIYQVVFIYLILQDSWQWDRSKLNDIFHQDTVMNITD